MRDPERLVRDPSSPLALLALRACADERPSAAALRRAEKAAVVAAATGVAAQTASAAAMTGSAKLAAVTQVTAAAGGASSAAGGSVFPTGASVALGTVAKWFGIGALGGVLASPVALVIPEPGAKELDPPAALTAPMNASRRGAPSPERTLSIPKVAEVARADDLERAHETEKHTAKTPDTSAVDPQAPEASERTAVLLAAEVRFVDQGRAALQRGAHAEALALLTAYEERFPRHQLLTEVLFLRMEAWSRLGDAERARSLAARVITRGIAGPQAARAREVLGR